MADSGTYTQDVYQRRSQIAQKLLEQARGNPSRNWAEGLGNLSETALGAFQQAKADAQQKVDEYKGKKELNEALGLPAPPPPSLGSSGASQIAGVFGMDWPSVDAAAAPQQTGFQKIASLFNGGGGPTTPAVAAPVAGPPPTDQAAYALPPAAPPAAAPPTFRPGITAPATDGAPDYSKAIAGIESGGAYDKLGPVVKSGDRAYGKYQVMGNNIPEWTTQVLGKPMTPAEFLANPDAQEAVFKSKFGDYVQKYGPEGAAKAWFAGEKGMNNPNAKDVLGTTVAGYADKFNRALGGPPPEITTGQSIPPSSGPGAVFNSLDAAADIPPSSGPGAVFNSLDAAANSPAAPQIASALAATPAQGVAPPTAPPASGGLLAGVPRDKKLQIAQMLSSTNPTVRAMGSTIMQQALKPETTDEIKEYNLYATQAAARGEKPLPFFDYKAGLKKAGAVNVTTNIEKPELAFDTEAGKLQAKRFDELAADGQTAKQMVSDIQTLTDLGKNIGTGKTAEFKAAIGPYAEALGLKIDGLSDIQAYEAVVNRLAPNLRVKGSGAQSDMELKNFLKSLPSLGNTPEGNEIASSVLTGLQENKIRAAEIGSKALTKEISRSDAEKQLRELPDPMIRYREYMKANRGAPTATGDKPAAPDKAAIEAEMRRRGLLK